MRGVKSLNMAAVEDFLYRGEGESVFEEAQMQCKQVLVLIKTWFRTRVRVTRLAFTFITEWFMNKLV